MTDYSQFGWPIVDGPSNGYVCIGISYDGETLIKWRENLDHVVSGKTYWEKVDKIDLIQDPHDFLK